MAGISYTENRWGCVPVSDTVSKILPNVTEHVTAGRLTSGIPVLHCSERSG